MKKLNTLCFLLGLFVVVVGSLPACGQVDSATATLKGTVIDPQGAVLVGAAVTATNAGTGISRTGKTASDGRYQIAALPPGLYQITFEAKGFTKEVPRAVT